MPISTRLTDLLGVQHPILLAPMDIVSDGRLAAAVSRAGGFGILGGGYGDEAWLARELDAAGDARVGVGFITWSVAKRPRLLDLALERRPPAVMLSFSDVRPHAERIRRAGALLICQVQTLAQARDALAAGADVLVAGGRGGRPRRRSGHVRPRACYEPGIGSPLVLSFGPGSELPCLTFHRSGRLVFLSVVGAVKQDGQVARLGPDQYRAPGPSRTRQPGP